ncbi:MAG: Ig-like domain-containing protein [Patescibacteria group bacterium]
MSFFCICGFFQPVLADTTFTVNDLGDATDDNAGDGVCHTAGGVCTFRAAIVEINALAGNHTINFSVAGTIEVASVVTLSRANTTIDGGTNHDVVINGTGTAGIHCITINGVDNNIINGLVVQNCQYGFNLANDSDNNKIQNNYIGTNAAGTAAVANSRGISASASTTGNIIGTDGDGVNDASEKNLVSGNVGGIYMATATNWIVAGNYIGTNLAGTAAIANTNYGMYLTTSSNSNTIGTDGDGVSDDLERNVISGNSGATYGALYITGSNNNIIAGNYIGTNAAGTAAIANIYGVYITGASQSNIVGTNGDGVGDAAERNIISGHTAGFGVYIVGANSNTNRVAGNYIGINAAGTAAVANSSGVVISTAAQSNIVGTNGDGVADAAEQNVISGNTNYGVYITSANSYYNRVAGNYIGLNAAGDTAIPNTHGVYIYSSASYNTVGTNGDGVSDDLERNIISGNTTATGYGVYINLSSNSTTVAGNYIGLNAAGTAAIANDSGLVIVSSSSNTVGTNGDGVSDDLEKNVISGNTAGYGIYMVTSSNSNTVAGNYVGTNPAGDAAIPNAYGVYMGGASNSNIVGNNSDGVSDDLERNIISGNNGTYGGVSISGSSSNIVAGNYIGTNAAGTAAIANANGVYIFSASQSNIIGTNGDGTADATERNVISGNTSYGVYILNANSNSNRIAGNYIGTNAAGTAAVANGHSGVVISASAQSNIVGTNGDGVADAAEQNIISGNTNYGVYIVNANTYYNRVAGNYIGLNAAGDTAISNTYGVYIYSFASYNTVGTNGDGVSDDLERNIISGNTTATAYGVVISTSANSNTVAGNYVGTNPAGNAAIANDNGVYIVSGAQSNFVGTNGDESGDAVERNIISGNTGYGVVINSVTTISNTVAGNYIGLNAAGDAAVPNVSRGMIIIAAISNTIGTNSDGASDDLERNIISGNTGYGIELNTTITGSNKISGNYIGTNPAGTSAIANNTGIGLTYAAYQMIGTDGDGISDSIEGNLISGNTNYQIYTHPSYNNDYNTIAGNYIGLNVAGDAAIGAGSYGIGINGLSSDNIIGTDGDGVSDDLERNVIASQTNMIYVNNGDTNTIAGNYIGLNAAGTAKVGSCTQGIWLNTGASNNLIGTDGDGVSDDLERNVVAGCTYNYYITSAGINDGNTIAGNYSGLDADGDTGLGGTNGIYFYNTGTNTNNIIGTNGDGNGDAVEGNVVSGNTTGITIYGSNNTLNTVAGNIVGLDATGSAAIPNTTYGIYIYSGAASNTIGTDSDGTSDDLEKNIVSGNTTTGIYLSDASTSNNMIKGNYIGAGLDGVTDYGNGTHGIMIDDTATSNTIGGSGTYDANIIAYNGDGASEYGISIEDVNTDLHKISRNSIHDNQNEGIKLSGGSNDAIAVPSITGLADGGASATITLSGTCLVDAGTATVELFESDGSGEGETYITSTTSTDGNWSTNITGSYTTIGTKIVATATSSTNNTSEFSSEYTITDLAAQASTTGTADSIDEEHNASLVGTSSYDPNSGDVITYLWERTAGENIVINDADHATANFDAPDITGADSSVTVRLSVNGGDTDSKVINIVNTNDAPILSINIPDQSLDEDISENAKFDLDDYFTDVIPPGDTLSYTAIDDFNPALGTIDINADGTIDFNLAANANGSDTIQFRATDDLSAIADSNIITVTVDPINDAPTFSGPITVTAWDEDTDKNLAFDLDDNFSDIDAGDSCTYSVATDPANINATIDADNKVSFSPDANWNGNQTVKFICTDTGLATVDSNDIALTVNPVNDTPIANAGSNQTVTEDDAVVYLNGSGSSDIDTVDVLTYQWMEMSDSADACSLSGSTNVSSEVAVQNKNSNYSCLYSLTVNDGTIDSLADDILIEVTADNDAPTIVGISDVIIDENEPLIFSVAVNDIDSSDITLLALDEHNDFAAKSIDVNSIFTDHGNNTGTINWTPGLTQSGNYQLTIDAGDEINHTKEIINITVNNTYDENTEETEIAYLRGRDRGKGVVDAYSADDEIICSINAFSTGGAIPRLVKLNGVYYISVVKYRSGSTMHIYNKDCEFMAKKKLSPKLHIRRIDIGNLKKNNHAQEIVVSARRDGHVSIKIYRYDLVYNRWHLLKRTMINNVPRGYSLETEGKVVQIRNKYDKLLYTWKVNL